MAIGETLGLYFEIAADPSKAIRAVSDFQNSIEKSLGMARGSVGLIAQDIEKRWGLASGSLLRTGVAAQAAVKDLAYLTAGAGALAAGALVLADRWATAGTEIFEASEKTGMSAANLSGLRTSAKLLGEDFGTLTITMARMGRNIEAGLRNPSSEAGKTLGQLYKSTDELQKLGLMPLDQRLADVNKRIFALGSVSQQNIILQAEAGRGYMSVRSVLQDLGMNGYDPLIERAKKLGQYFDEESSRKARQFKIEMASLKAEMEGLALSVGQKVVPAFSQLIILSEIKLQQGLGKNLVQATRDAAAGMFWLGEAINLTVAATYKNNAQMDALKDRMNRLTHSIAGGSKEIQEMTNQFVDLLAMAAAVAKGQGDLRDAFKKTGKEADEAGQKMVAAIRSYTDLSRSLQVQLDAGSNAALKRYLETNNKILELSGKLDVTYLRQLNRTLFQKESTEELAKAETSLNAELSKHLPIYHFNLEVVTKLTAAERLRLPLIIDETNRLGQMLQASKSVVNELMLGELPARQRINLQIQRRLDLATREIEIKRKDYAETKKDLAGLEAAERQYNEVKKSLSEERRLLMQQETLSMRSSLMMFNQAMGMGIANAIVYGSSIKEAMAQALKATLASIAAEALIRAIFETGMGFAMLFLNPPAAAAHFQAAGIFGIIGGVAAGIGRAIPGGGQKVAGPTPYGVAGGSSGYQTGVATGAAVERGPVTVIHVHLDGKPLSINTLDEIIYQVSDRVENAGVVLRSTVAGRVEARS